MQVRDYVRLNIPETYSKMTNEGEYDGQKNPDVFGQAVDRAITEFVPEGTNVDDLPERARSILGDVATRFVIPAGIEYWAVQTRRTDSMNRPTGMEGLGGESSTNYDRVRMLQDLDNLLATRLASDLAELAEMVDPALVPSGAPKISTSADDFVTQDPDDFAGVGDELRYAGRGVVYVDRG